MSHNYVSRFAAVWSSVSYVTTIYSHVYKLTFQQCIDTLDQFSIRSSTGAYFARTGSGLNFGESSRLWTTTWCKCRF